jgi:ACR3 family arsenite efflux pump ArsB
MKQIAKALALPLLAAIAFLGFAYGSLYFAGYLFPRVVPRPYVEMVSAAAVGSTLAGLLVSLPLVKLYPSRYWLAGLLVASPLMVVRASDVAQYGGKNEPRIMVMSIVEFVIYPALILAVCWFVSRFYPRLRQEA